MEVSRSEVFEMRALEILPLFIFLPIAGAISIPEQGKFLSTQIHILGTVHESQVAIYK